MKKIKQYIVIAAMAAALVLGGCAETAGGGGGYSGTAGSEAYRAELVGSAGPEVFSLSEIPAYSGEPFVPVNGNVPYFDKSELTAESFESYSELDSLGRCGTAFASVGLDLMPTEKRGSIGQVKPTGWQTVKYEFVDGKYLYNRCHLIGYQLTAENANEKNLITGTRYMNVEGMLPFENMVADYVKETEKHVLYRVTPVFQGDNLVAEGVLMEALSVEDDGDSVMFCAFVYNVQPGVSIDYADGHSGLAEDAADQTENTETTASGDAAAETKAAAQSTVVQKKEYIFNTNTYKFHKPSCSSVSQMNESNKENFSGTREEAIAQGYEPCGKCKP